MSRGQLLVVALLSLACTAIVLGASAPRHEPRLAAVRLAAARRPVVVHAAAARVARVVAPAPVPEVTPTPTSAPAVAPAPAPDETPAPAPADSPAPTEPDTPKAPATPAGPTPSKAGHVFVLALAGTSYDAAFGADSAAPYLARTLAPQGVTLAGFRPLDAAALPNYLAMTGGQAPNDATRAECATFSEFPQGAKVGDDGSVAGSGCVYPNTVLTLGDQLDSTKRTWGAFVGGMGDQACRHPASDGPDDTLAPDAPYATRRNPFVYFHSLLDLGGCAADDVDLARLPAALTSTAKTPDYSYVAPPPCAAGTELPCADAFLHEWVPRIQRSPAYRHDGAIVIAFLSSPVAAGAAPPATGALVLSRFATPGKTLRTAYDPFALLHSLDELFGLQPLARAQSAPSFARTALPRAF